MGIRVHKAVGYGLSVKAKDPRVCLRTFRRLQERSWEEFLGWFSQPDVDAKFKALSVGETPRSKVFSILDLQWIIRQARSIPTTQLVEAGGRGVTTVLLLDPTEPRLYRYDNQLDNHEESYTHGQKNRIQRFDNFTGIWPYTGMKRIRRAPTDVWAENHSDILGVASDVDEHGPLRISEGAYKRLVGTWGKGVPALATGDLHKHLVEDFRPVIPMSVLAVALWYEAAFPQGVSAFLDAVRPMLAVWWE